MKERPKGLFYLDNIQLHTKYRLLFEHKEKSIYLARQTSPFYLIVTNSSEPVG